MTLNESEYIFENTVVKYKFKHADLDCQHLIVIFSGFGWPNSITYNFQGDTLQKNRSNILWIKDEFDSEATYYLCKGMDFSIENSVISLIEFILKGLNLSHNQCTLLGASKGGSSALYYGLKYNFKNIISCVPQMKIGSFSAYSDWPKTGEFMMGGITNEKVELLNNLLPNTLKNDTNTDKNIYLISSPNDEQFKEQIEPYLDLFSKYNNFNFIFNNSSLAWQHNVVTRYNLPIIISILYAHEAGIFPIFGNKIIKNIAIDGNDKERHLSDLCKKMKIISNINKLTFKDNLFFPEGDGFIKGYPCSSYNSIEQNLVIEKNEYQLSFPLSTKTNKNLSYYHFDRYFCDYSSGSFTSLNQKGIDLSLLKNGTYFISLELKNEHISLKSQTLTTIDMDYKNIVENEEIRIFSENSKLKITKRSVVGEQSKNNIFKIDKKWRKSTLIHYEGVFAIKGIEVKNWGDVCYYLIFQSEHIIVPFKIGQGHRPNLSEEISQGMANYDKAYFSTPNYAGIDISTLKLGKYKVLISMSHKGSLFTEDTGDEVIIDA
ncbi:MAG: hypothetical protein NT086_18745 [Proteobacteria bacterium]|nr:hypothetical protein [Pseudomonadota bacterium]